MDLAEALPIRDLHLGATGSEKTPKDALPASQATARRRFPPACLTLNLKHQDGPGHGEGGNPARKGHVAKPLERASKCDDMARPLKSAGLMSSGTSTASSPMEVEEEIPDSIMVDDEGDDGDGEKDDDDEIFGSPPPSPRCPAPHLRPPSASLDSLARRRRRGPDRDRNKGFLPTNNNRQNAPIKRWYPSKGAPSPWAPIKFGSATEKYKPRRKSTTANLSRNRSQGGNRGTSRLEKKLWPRGLRKDPPSIFPPPGRHSTTSSTDTSPSTASADSAASSAASASSASSKAQRRN